MYPEKLVRAICRGMQLELRHNGILSSVHQDLLTVTSDDADVINYSGHFIDDMSGQILDNQLVIQTRK